MDKEAWRATVHAVSRKELDMTEHPHTPVPASEPLGKPISLLDTFKNYSQFCSFYWSIFQKCFYIHQNNHFPWNFKIM